MSKSLPSKFHGSGGHNKRNYLQHRANFHRSRAWQIIIILNTVYAKSLFQILYALSGQFVTITLCSESFIFGRVEHAKSGRVMECLTDQPGVQFYTANWVENEPGKAGVTYQQHSALCLESQNYPDAPNKVTQQECRQQWTRDAMITSLLRQNDVVIMTLFLHAIPLGMDSVITGSVILTKSNTSHASPSRDKAIDCNY